MKKPNFSREEIRLCFLRSLCVALYVLFCLLIAHQFEDSIWMVSLAASAFIAFAFPKADSVRTSVLVGGYLSSCIWGVLLSLVLFHIGLTYTNTIVCCGIAIFLTSFCMTVLDLEHPPAAALAIGIVISSKPLELAAASMLCVIVLCLIKKPLARIVLREK